MNFIPDFDFLDYPDFDDTPSAGRTITVKIINDRIFAEDGDGQYIIINRRNGKIKSFLHGDEKWEKSGRVKNDKQAWKNIGHMFGIWNEMDSDYHAATH